MKKVLILEDSQVPFLPEGLKKEVQEVISFKRKVRKWGGSLALSIPGKIFRQTSIREGSQVEVLVLKDGRIIFASGNHS